MTREQLAAAVRGARHLVASGFAEEAYAVLALVLELTETPPPCPPTPPPSGDYEDLTRPLTNAERQKRLRERKRNENSNESNVTSNDGSNGKVTDRVTDFVTKSNASLRSLAGASEGFPLSSCRESISSPQKENSETRENAHERNVTSNENSNAESNGAVTARDALRVQGSLQRALGTFWDFHSWRNELLRIAMRPSSELEQVLAGLKADPWIRAKPARADPGHVLKRWEKYRTPEPAPLPATELKPPKSVHTSDPALEAQMRADLAGDAERDAPPSPEELRRMLGRIGRKV